MNTSKVSVLASEFLAKILKIAGYVDCVFFAVGLLAILTSADSDAGSRVLAVIIFGLFIAVGVFLIKKGNKIKRYVQRFRMYIGLISSGNVSAIDEIANRTNQSYDFVKKDLQSMIDKKYFANAYIDSYSNRIIVILPEGVMHFTDENVDKTSVDAEVVNCRGCGAANVIQKGTVGTCEYCGAPISK